MYEENEDCRKKNIERRRETSRFAARDRRGKEADIFSDLKDEVPIVHDATVTHVDRIALLRVAATFCRLRKCAAEVLRTSLSRESIGGIWGEEAILECFDGFVLLSDSDGTILYVSESVTLYLGLTQTDLTGRNLREFMHPSDYDEFVKLNGEIVTESTEGKGDREIVGENIVLRMKTVISPRGRNLNLKGALFKPISCLIRVMHSDGNAISLIQGCTVPAGQGSVSATANAITKNGESPNGTFMTRHTCDMRISYVSDTFNFILKNDARSLMGCSFYELVHPADAHIVHKSMRELFQKGHVRTPFYRLVAANNNLAWVITEATTINHTTRGQKGQYVICIHYVLGIQGESESLVICTDSQPAGMPVLKTIKAEIDLQLGDDIVGKELVGRQPAILECFDFTPLVPPSDESMSSPQQMMSSMSTQGRSSTRHSSPESRKTSYDAVLQWLFRDRPSSPAPEYREGHQGGPTLPPGHHPFASESVDSLEAPPPTKRSRREIDFSLCSSTKQIASSPVTQSVSSIPPKTHSFTGAIHRETITKEQQQNGKAYDPINTTSRTQQSQSAYSPLADGLADCALRSPLNPISPQNTRNMGECHTRMGGSIGGRSIGIDATTHSPRGLPTIPSNGSHPLSIDNQREISSLFSIMSSSNSLANQRSSDQSNRSNPSLPSLPSTSTQSFPSNHRKDDQILQESADAVNKALADLDFPFEDLHSVAPFVPQEELQPISDSVAKDFQTLFPDLPDWTPTEPVASAGRQAKVDDGEEQDEGPLAKRLLYNGTSLAHPHPPSSTSSASPSCASSPSTSSPLFPSHPSTTSQPHRFLAHSPNNSHLHNISHHSPPQIIPSSPRIPQNGPLPQNGLPSPMFFGSPFQPPTPGWMAQVPTVTQLTVTQMTAMQQGIASGRNDHRFPQNTPQNSNQWMAQRNPNPQIVHRI